MIVLSQSICSLRGCPATIAPVSSFPTGQDESNGHIIKMGHYPQLQFQDKPSVETLDAKTTIQVIRST